MFACREEEAPLPDCGAREARKFSPSSRSFPPGDSTSPLFREKCSFGVGGFTGTLLIGFFGEGTGLLAGGDWK